MNISISKIISIASVLGCLGIFVPSQVLGTDNLCNFYTTKNKKDCEKQRGCEWVILAPGSCFGEEKICNRDIIHHDQNSCNLQAKNGCGWRKEVAFCYKKGSIKNKQEIIKKPSKKS